MTDQNDSMEQNAPEEVEHCCARCLRPVKPDAQACGNCSRRFVGRGRFHRLSVPPPSVESLSMLRLHEAEAS